MCRKIGHWRQADDAHALIPWPSYAAIKTIVKCLHTADGNERATSQTLGCSVHFIWPLIFETLELYTISPLSAIPLRKMWWDGLIPRIAFELPDALRFPNPRRVRAG